MRGHLHVLNLAQDGVRRAQQGGFLMTSSRFVSRMKDSLMFDAMYEDGVVHRVARCRGYLDGYVHRLCGSSTQLAYFAPFTRRQVDCMACISLDTGVA